MPKTNGDHFRRVTAQTLVMLIMNRELRCLLCVLSTFLASPMLVDCNCVHLYSRLCTMGDIWWTGMELEHGSSVRGQRCMGPVARFSSSRAVGHQGRPLMSVWTWRLFMPVELIRPTIVLFRRVSENNKTQYKLHMQMTKFHQWYSIFHRLISHNIYNNCTATKNHPDN